MQNNGAIINSGAAEKLSFGDRFSAIRGNRYVTTVLPFVSLATIIIIFGALTEGRFFTMRVLTGILSQALIIGTCATGVSFIYSNGNLDISIGSVMSVTAILGAIAYNATASVPIMLAVCVITATAIMLFNCTLSTILNIKTILVAIVVSQIYTAFARIMVGGAGLISIDYGVAYELSKGSFRFIAFFAYFALCVVLYHFTKIGRSLRFIGGNETCAKQTGMSNTKSTYISFLITGIGVGLAAIFGLLDVSSASAETGGAMGMNVMLATVLGGMSIFGGSRSNVYAGLIGALTVAALNKGMLMAGVSSAAIQGIRGAIFILLVYLNSERESLLPTRVQF